MSKRSNNSSPKGTSPTSAVVLTPASPSPSSTPNPDTETTRLDLNVLLKTSRMDTTRDEKTSMEEKVEIKQAGEPSTSVGERTATEPEAKASAAVKSKKKAKCKKHKHKKSSKRGKKHTLKDLSSSSSSSSESEDTESESESESESSSEDERRRRKERKKKAAKRKAKLKSQRKHKKYESSSDSESESPVESPESESEEEPPRRSRKVRSRRDEPEDDADAEADEDGEDADDQALIEALSLLKTKFLRKKSRRSRDRSESPERGSKKKSKSRRNSKRSLGKRASTLEYKRVDELWDSTIHNYKLTESAEDQADEFGEYIFTVRRKFDWENKYRNTVVDIKSKLLRDALADVMKDVKGISLVEEEPSIDPNMLFLYLEELRTYAKKTLKASLKKEKKRKQKKRISLQISQCKIMIAYLDQDYEDTKKTLYPMLEAGNITFELLWALFKPNTIAFTNAYGSTEDPRCFKVDYATKDSSFMRGEWYCIEGRYLEYDGKSFGLGEFEIDVESFKGPRKITSLSTYPLKYHKDPSGIKKQLVERGKRFVSMQGMNYRFHKGLAFQKKKKNVAKVNINGRIMIDPAIFRRINPNYPISYIKPKDSDDNLFGSDCCDCSDCAESSSDEDFEGGNDLAPVGEDDDDDDSEKKVYKVVTDKDDELHVVEVPVGEDGQEIRTEKIEKITDGKEVTSKEYEFSEEELLIASPVVLGFAFSEKLWLEFSLGGVTDIKWNEGAFESLVLPANHKSIVRGMVSSHKFHAAQTIDDVVQGKGKGLVFVLHGPPGVGKTLTAEGIAEYLKCPLYAVSAGELGTDSRQLEQELQKIMDIAHSWGAILLLDEADVFLEKREVHDIHRNALVSIFLRLLEYFQGILFLTTNRVETFDDAFQSRIHMALHYGELSHQARKAIWQTFLEKVRAIEGKESHPFTAKEYELLARNNLNGRQIKNIVRTAQSLALSEEQQISMEHIKRVLEVAESFNNDLKGGTGYLDAMRSYT